MTWTSRLEREFVPGVCRKDLFLSAAFAALALGMLAFGYYDFARVSHDLFAFLPAGLFLALSFLDCLLQFRKYWRARRLIRHGKHVMAKIVSVNRVIKRDESLDGTVDQYYLYAAHMNYITWNGARCLMFKSRDFRFDIEKFLLDQECPVYLDRHYEFQGDKRDAKHYYAAIDCIIDWDAK